MKRGLKKKDSEHMISAGKNYLLIIGIDKYHKITPLNNAVKDSKAVRDILLERYTFEVSELVELYDKDATRRNVISAFDTLADKITKDDSGNAWEWCWDWYDHNYYQNSPTQNPKGPNIGDIRVIRGGSYYCNLADLRVVDRYYWHPKAWNRGIGFRLARNP